MSRVGPLTGGYPDLGPIRSDERYVANHAGKYDHTGRLSAVLLQLTHPAIAAT